MSSFKPSGDFWNENDILEEEALAVALIRLRAPLTTCVNCKITETPQWRKGWHVSDEKRYAYDLCNGCGIRFHKMVRGKLSKPPVTPVSLNHLLS